MKRVSAWKHLVPSILWASFIALKILYIFKWMHDLEEDFVFGEDEDRLRFFSDGARVSKVDHLSDLRHRFEVGIRFSKLYTYKMRIIQSW